MAAGAPSAHASGGEETAESSMTFCATFSFQTLLVKSPRGPWNLFFVQPQSQPAEPDGRLTGSLQRQLHDPLLQLRSPAMEIAECLLDLLQTFQSLLPIVVRSSKFVHELALARGQIVTQPREAL